jgi:HEAT repeat protein
MEQPGAAARDVPDAVVRSVELLKAGDAAARISAARQLGELGRRAEAALPALVEALQDDEEHTLCVFWDDRATTPLRLAVAEALAKISPAGVEAAVPVLIELLGHHDAYDRNDNSTQPAVADLLTTIGAAAVPALRKALRAKNREVRELAQEVLQRIHSDARENEGKREIHDS